VWSGSAVLNIRKMNLSDISFGMQLVETAGWNQVPADWERLLRVAPDGCFLGEWDGRPAGTATAVRYGGLCGWVGMVLVDPVSRRRGIGGALLLHCVDYLKSLGVRTIKLDATEEGREVYLKHGFVDEFGTLRYQGELKPAGMRESPIRVRRPIQDRDAPALQNLDMAVFGVDRSKLLNVLIEQQPDLTLVATDDGLVVGYGLARPGRLHGYIGPLVAGRMVVAKLLLAKLAERLEQRTVLVDTTALNTSWCRWLEASGLRVQRRLTRMYLGANDRPGDTGRMYALSGFETG
jgi:ribosomal protein S18 acetylase RimI-like enzyme